MPPGLTTPDIAGGTTQQSLVSTVVTPLGQSSINGSVSAAEELHRHLSHARIPNMQRERDNKIGQENYPVVERHQAGQGGTTNNINTLSDLIAALLLPHNIKPPFSNDDNLYKVIDSTPLGGIPWQMVTVHYNGERPDQDIPPWMDAGYEVSFRDPREVVRNMLANPSFNGQMDYAPYWDFDENDEQEWQDLMLGEWAWKHADEIAKDPSTHGSMFVPVILRSDKTTVLVATGQNDYYLIYVSIGNVHNNVRRAHRNAVAVVGFLAMPKTTQEHAPTPQFRKFRHQLFHSSVSTILQSLKPAMTTPKVAMCADGHYRKVIYGIGLYITDYEEQVLLACIVKDYTLGRCNAFAKNLDGSGMLREHEHTEVLVKELDLSILWDEYGIVGELVPFTNGFPRADIREIMAPDILHQLIKGVCKDHLIVWVQQYLELNHTKADAATIMDDIDHRIAAVAPCAGLRRFPEGHGFKQWTRDDSKALMKVYLPTIKGHVP
ncbi:hypothetical protein BV22DRAFT_1134733 [Leucogyrophana mollusca]|uniref:Uncharacterized protein n=1 Tax=Leucogyrophana mollusca TaxID=85980 RepID=A0ACB8B0M0_9AGAM|nr:hypothetical protein BV22DRAFT_1134733 [Leucogyrophana mollusca]